MVARSAAEAVEAYRHSLQIALSCVTHHVLITFSTARENPYQPGENPHVLALNSGNYAPLSCPQPLAIRVLYRYDIVRAEDARTTWTVRTREYTYSLALLDGEQREEIIAYHWQPDIRDARPWPHLHLGSAVVGTSSRFGKRHLHRMHFPTSIVPLESIIRLTIDEFGVRPLRDDWQHVLGREQTA